MENSGTRRSDILKTTTACTALIVLFSVAELTISNFSSQLGVGIYFTALICLIIYSVKDSSEKLHSLWLALGLVPLIRILSLVMPQPEISEIFWYLIIAIPVFAGVFMVMRNLHLDFESVGLNGRKSFFQIGIAITGIGLGLIDYFILRPESLNHELTFQQTIFPAIVLLVSTGLIEELAFRGVMQKAASGLKTWGWVYVALVNSVLQIGQGSFVQVIFIFLVALFFGWAVKKTGSIIGVIFAHGFLNIGLFLVFPHIF
jgi:membrane protease YdiL (CAAX protease family)